MAKGIGDGMLVRNNASFLGTLIGVAENGAALVRESCHIRGGNSHCIAVPSSTPHNDESADLSVSELIVAYARERSIVVCD